MLNNNQIKLSVMATTNKVSEILVNAGYSKTDNRSYFTKSLNKVIEDGFVSIQLMTKGKVWLGPDGTQKGKYNFIVRGYGKMMKFYLSNVTPNSMLRKVGEFVMNPVISDLHISTLHVSENRIEPCGKCNGKGIIPLFSYYCNGLCFDCYGSKYMIVKRDIVA